VSEIPGTLQDLAEKVAVLDFIEAQNELRQARAVMRGISLALTGKSELPHPWLDCE
jgi:hypothetical protein